MLSMIQLPSTEAFSNRNLIFTKQVTISILLVKGRTKAGIMKSEITFYFPLETTG